MNGTPFLLASHFHFDLTENRDQNPFYRTIQKIDPFQVFDVTTPLRNSFGRFAEGIFYKNRDGFVFGMWISRQLSELVSDYSNYIIITESAAILKRCAKTNFLRRKSHANFE